MYEGQGMSSRNSPANKPRIKLTTDGISVTISNITNSWHIYLISGFVVPGGGVGDAGCDTLTVFILYDKAITDTLLKVTQASNSTPRIPVEIHLTTTTHFDGRLLYCFCELSNAFSIFACSSTISFFLFVGFVFRSEIV